MGVPLVKEVLNVGLALITLCEASKMLKFPIIVLAADNHVVPKAVNDVQEMVAQLKNRVAEYLLVIAKIAKNTENSLTKTSNHVMDELKELKEYVREKCLPVGFAHVHVLNSKVSYVNYPPSSRNQGSKRHLDNSAS